MVGGLPRPWPEKLCVHFTIPFVKLVPHVGRPFGVDFRKIASFARVVCQVVKVNPAVLETLDHLPVSHPDGGTGESALVAVVRVMPVKGFSLEGFASLQQGHQVDAVDGSGSLNLAACRLDEGGEEIGAHHGMTANGSGLGLSGPSYQEGLAYPAFVKPALASTQGKVGGGGSLGCGKAAVIRGEGDHDLVFKAKFPK